MDLINRAKKLRAIQAIQKDLDSLGQAPVVQAIQRDLGDVGASTRNYVSALAADARRASEKQMDKNVGRDMTIGLTRGNKGAQNAVAETLSNASEDLYGTILREESKDAYLKKIQAEDFSTRDAIRYGKNYAYLAERPERTPRARMQQLLGVVEQNPGRTIAAGAGAGTVGGVALITASGQALADLGNFLAGGQENQETRDNVLRS
tara:strand:- start:236 stop:853 length:618 start_codon:yes stop_codon:yes gene_type:complete